MCGMVSRLGAVLALCIALIPSLQLPLFIAAQNTTTTVPEDILTVYKAQDNTTVATNLKEGTVEVRTGRELVDIVRDGYQHILLRAHVDLSDDSEVTGMEPGAVLVPPMHLSILGMCDGPDAPPDTTATHELLPNQCVLKMAGNARFFLASDGHKHQILIKNVLIARQHESGGPLAAISMSQGQIALYETTIESDRYIGAPAMVMDSASAFIASSSFVGNSGPSGGAIALVRSAMNVTNTMFHRNTAQGATQAGTQRGHGGAVWSRASVATVHDCTFSENYADGEGGAWYFEGPTLATVYGTNFSQNTANGAGRSIALSSLGGLNTLVLTSPIFEPILLNLPEASENATNVTADAHIYMDGQSIDGVHIVNPETSVMLMGPKGNTWPANPEAVQPVLPPAQGFVQPKVLSGKESWIRTASKVLEAAGAARDNVPTVQPPPTEIDDSDTQPWLFICGIILASVGMLCLLGITFRMCRKRSSTKSGLLPFLWTPKEKQDRSGKMHKKSGSDGAHVVSVDASMRDSQSEGSQSEAAGSFMAWQDGDLQAHERPPSPPRMRAFTGQEDRFGVGGGNDAAAAAAAVVEPSAPAGNTGKGARRSKRLGAWAARYRPATINEEDENNSEGFVGGLEEGPEGPGGGMIGAEPGGSGSNEHLDVNGGPTAQSDAMLPQIMAPSDSLASVGGPGKGGSLASWLPPPSSPGGVTGSSVATGSRPLDGSATLVLRESNIPAGSSQGVTSTPAPMMPQHSASTSISQSVAFSHSLALSTSRVSEPSTGLPSSRHGSGGGGASSSGFTFARAPAQSSSFGAATAALGAPLRDSANNGAESYTAGADRTDSGGGGNSAVRASLDSAGGGPSSGGSYGGVLLPAPDSIDSVITPVSGGASSRASDSTHSVKNPPPH